MKKILEKLKISIGLKKPSKIDIFMEFFKQKKVNKKKMFFIIFFIVTFTTGLISSLFVFNHLHKDRNQNFEATFFDPHQAIIFWTTENDTIGFVRYGNNKNVLDKVSYQTSSVKGTVHAVVIEEIPLEGVYLSLHNESDSPFLFTQIQRIVFDASKYVE